MSITQFTVIAIIGGAILSIGGVLYSSHRVPGFWVIFFGATVIFFSGFSYWYGLLKPKETNIPNVTSSAKKKLFEQPTFSENITQFTLSLGEGGAHAGFSKSELENSFKEPFSFNDYKPVKVYIKNDILYADVKIYGGSGFPPIEIKENKLSHLPTNWDWNSNKNALEIVNKNQDPMYQFFYKNKSHIVINGIFPFPRGLILADRERVIINPKLSKGFKLDRVFKYPSWKYPGQYDSD